MNSTLEQLRAANTGTVTLPSGLEVTGTLPRVRDCLIAGDIPLPVLAHIEQRAKNEPDPDLSADELRAVASFNDNLVLAFVTHIGGEPVTLEPSDLAVLAEDDFNELVLYASRAKPLPGKD